MKFSGFKVPKHRKFGYVPRFYDPEKEELEKRVKRYEAGSEDKELVKERISDGFRQSYHGNNTYRKSLILKSTIRLVLIILVLLFLSYLFLTSSKITAIIESFSG